MKSSGGRWYVVVLTAFAAVAMVWGRAEKTQFKCTAAGFDGH